MGTPVGIRDPGRYRQGYQGGRAPHLHFQGGVVHRDHLGQDAGAQRGAVVLIEGLVHVLVQQGGFAHAGGTEGTRVKVLRAEARLEELVATSMGAVHPGDPGLGHAGGFLPAPATKGWDPGHCQMQGE